MGFHNCVLKESAKKSLSGTSFDHRRMILCWAGAICLMSIAVSFLVFWMNREIETTGGISGIDRRNLLTTTTVVAQLLQAVLLLFLGFGYTSVAIDLARDHLPEKGCLLDGFRHYGVILRLTFLKGTLIGGVLFISIQIGSFLFCMTPMAAPLVEFTETYLESTDYAAMEKALMAVLEQVQQPLMLTVAIVFVGLGIPLLFRFRMADLIVMDDPNLGALKAVTGSAKLLRGKCWMLFRLDLHFWWYHGIYLLLLLLGSAGFLSSFFGISLSFDPDMFALISTIAAAIGMFLLAVWRKNLVRLTYVNAYDFLLDPPREPESCPDSHPWNY